MSVHMTEDGSVSDAEIAYTERRAMGGVSMIIVGSLWHLAGRQLRRTDFYS